MTLRLRRGLLGIVALMWLTAVLLPALKVAGSDMPGWAILASGWLAAMIGYADWLANPLLVAACIALWGGAPRPARIGMAAALFVLVALSLSRTSIPVDEAGVPRPIEVRHAGYFLWLGSLSLAGLGLLPAWRTR